MNAFGKRFLALMLSLSVSVAFVEVAMRLMKPAPAYTDTSVDNRFTGYRLPDNWKARRASPDIVRVLVLGDSFTWGDGVHEEDAYPHRMQFRLNLYHPERRYEVLNAGRNGLNTVDQRELLDSLDLLASDPDLVLVGFTLNDPEPSKRMLALELRKPTQRRELVGIAELHLYKYSRLFRLVYDRLENTRQRRAFNDYVASLFDAESEHWRACVDAMTSFRDHLGGLGIPFLVAVLPAFDAPFDDAYPYLRQHERVMATLADLGIPALDLRSLYDGVEVRRLAVTPFTDAHPNELAHRIAADFLALRVGECLVVETDEAGETRRDWRCEEGG